MSGTRSQGLITRARSRRWTRGSAPSSGCRGYLRRLRWPEGFVCRRCGALGEPWVTARRVLHCRACAGETSLTAGTIFEGTRKPLRMWFLAMWFVTSQKNGVSALGLQRVLGLGSYETAWTWLHKLRRAMVRPGRDCLTGTVEVDETYVGGPEAGKRGREVETKAIVVVAAEQSGRGVGRIRLRRVKDVSADSLRPFVQGAVVPGAVVSHRRMVRLLRVGGSRLPAPGHRHHERGSTGARGHAARPHGRLAAQAVADRHAPRRHPAPASRLLPRRIHVPFQPPALTSSRVALSSPRPTVGCRPSRPLSHDRRSPPRCTWVKGIPSLIKSSVYTASCRTRANSSSRIFEFLCCRQATYGPSLKRPALVR